MEVLCLAVLTVDIKSNTFQMESKQGREPSGNEDFNHALNRKQAATNEFLSVQQPLNSNKIYWRVKSVFMGMGSREREITHLWEKE